MAIVNHASMRQFGIPSEGRKKTMAKQGNDIAPTRPEEAQRFFRSEIARYAALAKKTGIRIE